MSEFFKPYEGSRPFLFVSYAHRQSDAVVDTIRILHERGWRLWYDEGIPAGSDWPSNIARHMQSCERVLFFLSRRAAESANCYSEIRTAARLGKPILVIPLEETDPDASWQELLSGKPAVPLLESPSGRAEAILRSGFLKRRLHHSWMERVPWQGIGLAASLLFFLAASGALAALASGVWDPFPAVTTPPDIQRATPVPQPIPTAVPTLDLGDATRYFAASFPDKQQERAIRKALGIPSGEIYYWQLAEISELYFCGNIETNSLENITFDENGTCRVYGAQVVTGRVSDLSLLGSAVRLKKLALICQPVDDLYALDRLQSLEELSLAGSKISDLGTPGNLSGLEILHLEHTKVRDLTPLASLPRLNTVTVSREMLPLRWKDPSGFSIILVS